MSWPGQALREPAGFKLHRLLGLESWVAAFVPLSRGCPGPGYHVDPGLMEGTRMTSKLSEEHFNRSKNSSALQRLATKEDVAAAVVMFAKTDSITGQSLVIDSGRCFK